MAYVHIAHDCVVGNHTMFSNNATLAGHVTIGDYAILSGFSGVHQFCRIGAHAFIGMGCLVNGDVPPFVMVAADYGRPRGINSEGLKRRGFDADAHRRDQARLPHAVSAATVRSPKRASELASIAADSEDVAAMLDFIERSERAMCGEVLGFEKPDSDCVGRMPKRTAELARRARRRSGESFGIRDVAVPMQEALCRTRVVLPIR